MKIEDIKGTLYDFFGYFSPGILLITLGSVALLHSKGVEDYYSFFKNNIEKVTTIEIFVVIFLAYILGHATAGISSFIIEKNIIKRIKRIDGSLCVNKILSVELYNVFEQKFQQTFNISYKENMFRTVICYVQAKQTEIYQTAFVFLSFYGMARNFTLIFASTFLWETYNALFLKVTGLGMYIALYFILMVTFGHEYYRFLKYFKNQIANGFLLE